MPPKGVELPLKRAHFEQKSDPAAPKLANEKNWDFEVENICFPPVVSKNERRIPTDYFWLKNRFPGSEST